MRRDCETRPQVRLLGRMAGAQRSPPTCEKSILLFPQAEELFLWWRIAFLLQPVAPDEFKASVFKSDSQRWFCCCPNCTTLFAHCHLKRFHLSRGTWILRQGEDGLVMILAPFVLLWSRCTRLCYWLWRGLLWWRLKKIAWTLLPSHFEQRTCCYFEHYRKCVIFYLTDLVSVPLTSIDFPLLCVLNGSEHLVFNNTFRMLFINLPSEVDILDSLAFQSPCHCQNLCFLQNVVIKQVCITATDTFFEKELWVHLSV